MKLYARSWPVAARLLSAAFAPASRLPTLAALLLAVFGLSIAAHGQITDSPRVLSQSYAQSIVVDSNGHVFYIGTHSSTPNTTFLAGEP